MNVEVFERDGKQVRTLKRPQACNVGAQLFPA